MAEPLHYATPTPKRPARHSVLRFAILFLCSAVVSSYGTDALSHWWIGKPSDGGGFLVGLWLIVPSSLAFLIAKASLGQRLPISPLVALIWGALTPPIGIALLIVFHVI